MKVLRGEIFCSYYFIICLVITIKSSFFQMGKFIGSLEIFFCRMNKHTRQKERWITDIRIPLFLENHNGKQLRPGAAAGMFLLNVFFADPAECGLSTGHSLSASTESSAGKHAALCLLDVFPPGIWQHPKTDWMFRLFCGEIWRDFYTGKWEGGCQKLLFMIYSYYIILYYFTAYI